MTEALDIAHSQILERAKSISESIAKAAEDAAYLASRALEAGDRLQDFLRAAELAQGVLQAALLETQAEDVAIGIVIPTEVLQAAWEARDRRRAAVRKYLKSLAGEPPRSLGIVSVWKGYVGVGEKCLLQLDGNYYGIDSRRVYPRGEYRHSPVYLARVTQAVEQNETGMYYRDERNHPELVGQTVEVDEAHLYGGAKVWRTLREGAYLAAVEIELVSEEPIR